MSHGRDEFRVLIAKAFVLVIKSLVLVLQSSDFVVAIAYADNVVIQVIDQPTCDAK